MNTIIYAKLVFPIPLSISNDKFFVLELDQLANCVWEPIQIPLILIIYRTTLPLSLASLTLTQIINFRKCINNQSKANALKSNPIIFLRERLTWR